MRFGKTLSSAIYPPWRDNYIDYTKLKRLLREGGDEDDSDDERRRGSDEGTQWTENDESVFVEELINVQLEKVHGFQARMSAELKDRTAKCEARLEKLVNFTSERKENLPRGKGKQVEGDEGKEGEDERKYTPGERQEILKQTSEELDEITRDINELERYSRINFTGFLKAAKKHDRKYRGPGIAKQGKGKGKERAPVEYKVRPILQVRLSQLEFNREDYSPMLYRLSAMYAFVRENVDKDINEPIKITSTEVESPNKATSGVRQYTSHKFWVHRDNILEVKTFVLRHLPVLIYNSQPSKEISLSNRKDPTITSLYFDNPEFSLYTAKVLKEKDASSVRLRWFGQLSESPEITLERKTIHGNSDDEGAIEEKIQLKEKYVNDFINGDYSMEKTIQKRRERGGGDQEIAKYQSLVESLQSFIKDNDLQPVLRAVYTRTAFQIPGDDTIRVSLDTDLALIREDALDSERPCRNPEDWHRKDIDDAEMEYPFPALRKGEISRFPYALLEIKVVDSELRGRSKEWLHELMNSHLMFGAPRFSKFVHGAASLFDDYVNCFPFWLSEMDNDIRKDPKEAWAAELERMRKQQEEQTAVGSFNYTVRDFGGRGTPPTIGDVVGHHSPPRGKPAVGDSNRFPSVAPQGPGKVDIKMLQQTEEQVEEDVSDNDKDSDEGHAGKPIDNFRNLFPSFSASSRYGRAHSGRRRDVQLPPGVQKPSQLLMHSGPVQVEAKVWLANQRTFIKWMHVSVLLATLALALYNAAGDTNHIARRVAITYTAIAVFAAAWGYWAYIYRSNLIRQRSGKDFDNSLGPIVVCIALAVALIINFAFKYQAAVARAHGDEPITTAAPKAATLKNTTFQFVTQHGY